MEFCDRKGLFALDCHTASLSDNVAGQYGPYLPCMDLVSGKHAARLNSSMNTAIQPKDTEPHYQQGPEVLSPR